MSETGLGETRYKVVETQTVTDEVLERLINCWVSKGWHLDGIRFAMSDASRRPAMAFILFVCEDFEGEDFVGEDVAGEDAVGEEDTQSCEGEDNGTES
jgi:hypothetical protein